MGNHAMLLEKHKAVRKGRLHDGNVMVMRSNLRWYSDGLEFTCWNGEVIRLAFIIDAFDSEIIAWTAVANAGKKTKGRKHHIIVDTLGLMVSLMVHSADIQDRDGAPDLLKSIRHRWPWLLHVFADGDYVGDKLKRRLKTIGRWTI